MLNITKEKCKVLANLYTKDELALLLWDKGKAQTLESGMEIAIEIINFSKGNI